MTRRTTTALRITVSLGLLTLLLTQVNAGAVAARLAALDVRWLLPIFALTVLQVIASAWRWRFTAARLGLPLPLGTAIREYYLATFANQVLPGGVLGDVGRAGRHAMASGEPGPAARAVVLERASGQVAAAVITVAALAVGAPALPSDATTVALIAGGVIATLAAMAFLRVRRQPAGMLAVFWRDTVRALLSRDAWLPQLAGSLAIAASYVGVYALAGIALDTPDLTTWLPLVPLVLLAMVIPISVAGWGVREGVAAATWTAAGLNPADGTALAIAYGALVLVASLPGLVFLLFPATGGAARSSGPSR
ncbi:lysylphosphatidylglycerol synthase transmembrane domain-containing protein [Halofilum ochraceum]|uniref:lysylphosphatidylglycerol synthase transmembrane domain-containing protein n=1 Tax=Halofilum ochraceum TaxID=1611323 RepID=UPI0008DA446C|nr:lysylphosphatidylglycerol synthase transmembrane domain-containing protein [Halofilum ochraceum]